MTTNSYRLITRADMDGLICATLLKSLGLINDILFVHPKDMQDGLIEVGSNDITTNLPYVKGAYLSFDHHFSETLRNKKESNHIIDANAPSAAQVVFDYYGGKESFPTFYKDMMIGVNKADSADFTIDEVLNAKGWVLLSFIMDSRTGLGRFKDFEVDNYDLMLNLIDYCKDYEINRILDIDEVKQRVDLYFKYINEFNAQLKECSTIYDNVIVIDYREEKIIYTGNRFQIYAMYPDVAVSIHISNTYDNKKVVYSCGKSIINKSSKTNIGELMLEFGGGGHKAAGGCQILLSEADIVLDKIIYKINSDYKSEE
ncbi:MAG: exopolyphosphatase [Campylobacteraceae bacterium]|nr:exopolyphosphatase [Campylobacteraceae bacterium]